MKTVWENEALDELNEAIKFIAFKSPQNAIMVLEGLLEFADTLNNFPLKFLQEPSYNKENVRVALKYNHKLIYQVEKERIVILRVFSARKNPTILKP